MNSFLASFISLLTTILYIAILVRAVLSWLPIKQHNPISIVVYQITEPILAPLRRVIPRLGPFDLSLFVAVLILIFIQRVAVEVLR